MSGIIQVPSVIQIPSLTTEGKSLQIVNHEGINLCIITNGHAGDDAITVSRTELIKALWPEGVEALKELSDIVQGMAEGESYQPDSFTGQPARLALAILEQGHD